MLGVGHIFLCTPAALARKLGCTVALCSECADSLAVYSNGQISRSCISISLSVLCAVLGRFKATQTGFLNFFESAESSPTAQLSLLQQFASTVSPAGLNVSSAVPQRHLVIHLTCFNHIDQVSSSALSRSRTTAFNTAFFCWQDWIDRAIGELMEEPCGGGECVNVSRLSFSPACFDDWTANDCDDILSLILPCTRISSVTFFGQ